MRDAIIRSAWSVSIGPLRARLPILDSAGLDALSRVARARNVLADLRHHLGARLESLRDGLILVLVEMDYRLTGWLDTRLSLRRNGLR